MKTNDVPSMKILDKFKEEELMEVNSSSERLKLLVGLGNPTEKYENTRHNVGFLFLNSLPDTIGPFTPNKKYFCEMTALYKRKVNLIKPTTFMNSSGKAVAALFNYFKVSPDDLYVIHDDLDIKLGEYKIQKGIGPKLHNGIESIEESLHTKDFWRVRIGVDNREPENRIPGEEYVLQQFLDTEIKTLHNVFTSVKDELQKQGII